MTVIKPIKTKAKRLLSAKANEPVMPIVFLPLGQFTFKVNYDAKRVEMVKYTLPKSKQVVLAHNCGPGCAYCRKSKRPHHNDLTKTEQNP
jgi:hypothetical protein